MAAGVERGRGDLTTVEDRSRTGTDSDQYVQMQLRLLDNHPVVVYGVPVGAYRYLPGFGR